MRKQWEMWGQSSHLSFCIVKQTLTDIATNQPRASVGCPLFIVRATTLDTAIICGLISAASAIIVSVITAVYNNKLIVYRLEQLEKKMDGNSELTKRVVVLETKVEALENDGK